MAGDGAIAAGPPGGATYAAFCGAVVIGGANFVAVSLSNAELPPMFGAMVRFGLASLLVLLLARARGVPLARGRAARGALLYGILGFGASYALLYYALVGLPAGATAVIVAAAPLFTLLIAVFLGQERLSPRGVGGGVLAVAGIAVLSTGTLSGDIAGSYLLAAVLGTLAMALATVVAKAYAGVHPLQMNAMGMVAGTILLGVTSLTLGEAWSLPTEGRTWLAVAWLVVLGSVGLFQLFLYVVRRWTASATAYAVAAMPVVAALLGALVLDQPITGELVAGGVMVIAAVYVGAMSRRAARGAVAAAPTRRTAGGVELATDPGAESKPR
jgi:drug/metabolite transporter (DMT)-like permease